MNNQRKKGALLSYVYMGLSSLISIVYTPLMLRLMGQSEYGLYTLVASVIGYLSVLDLGFGNAIIRYTARYRAKNDKEGEYRLNGMFLVLYTIIGVAAFILGMLLSAKSESIFGKALTLQELVKAKLLMQILTFNIAISFPLGIFSSIITAYERFVVPKVLNIIRAILQPCIMIPLLLMGYKSVAMAIVSVSLSVCILIFNTIYCFKSLHIRITLGKLDTKLLNEIIRFSFYIFLNIIVDKIYLSTDKFILGIESGTAAVAVYSIAMQLYDYYISFSTAINGVFLPKISIMVAEDASDMEISDLFIAIGRIQLMVIALILCGFIGIGRDFIQLWAGPQYSQAYFIGLILMVPGIVPLIQNTGIYILQARNTHRFRSIIYVLIAIANIAISIPLAKSYGGIGAAFGTAIATIAGQIITMNWYYYKRANIDIPRFWREAAAFLPSMAAAVGTCLVLNIIWNTVSYTVLAIKAMLCTAVYFASAWVFSMNSYEKQLIERPVIRIARRLGRLRG